MSLPDYISITVGPSVIPRHPEHPHGVALLPIGVTLDVIGRTAQRVAGVFLVDPDCANLVLNDTALDGYVKARIPVLLFATRARDLRPFLRRAEQFRRRGFAVEAIQ